MHRSFNAVLAAAFVATLAITGSAQAEIPEGDVYITVESGRITTGMIAEDESFTVPGVRVFYGELGLDLPNVGEDPGFKALAGTFAPGIQVGWDVLGSLRVWNGSTFQVSPSTMTLSFGPASVTTPLVDAPTSGFTITTDPDGEWHHHPFFELEAGAADGVYLIQLALKGDNLISSEPLWLLWDQNADAMVAEAAYDAALATIPTPGALMALAPLGLFAARRRR